MEKDIKEKEAKRLALEKAKIQALIEKHKPRTLKTPDEVNTSGTEKSANIDGKEGTKKGKPPHKKATKANQIKTPQNKGDKANKGNADTLLGDPMVNTKKGTYKAKEKEQKDTIGINDIGILKFIFQGLPNLPDLEGMDEDRLLESISISPNANPILREVSQITTEDEAMARVLSKSEDAAMVGPITRVTMALTNISIIHMINKQNSMAHPVAYAVVSIIPLSTATKENMT